MRYLLQQLRAYLSFLWTFLQVLLLHPRECQHAETQHGQCCELVYTPAYRPVASLSSPLLRRKTLVLDLDETLVHSTVKPSPLANFAVEVYLEGNYCKFHVFKRPFVDHFLRQVSEWYDIVIFTASLRQYADPVIDQLDSRNLASRRLFREVGGNFVKDFDKVGWDKSSTIIIDNSPIAYSNNRDNAIPIESFFGDTPGDQALVELLPILYALKELQDVRTILAGL